MLRERNKRFAAFLTLLLMLVAIAMVALLGRFASENALALIGGIVAVIFVARSI